MTTKKRTSKKRSGRSVEIAKIHIAATSLGLITHLDDSSYRDLLFAIARVRSSKDLDAEGRCRVLTHFKSIGWVDPSPMNRVVSTGSPQVRLIREFWRSLGNADALRDSSESALRAYIKSQSAPYHPDRVGYDAPELLPKLVAQRVIEHLKAWCRRVNAPIK